MIKCTYLNVAGPGPLDDLSSSVLAPDRRDQLIFIEFLAEAVVRFFKLEGRAAGMASSSSPSWTRKLDIESDDGAGCGTMRMLSGNQGVAVESWKIDVMSIGWWCYVSELRCEYERKVSMFSRVNVCIWCRRQRVDENVGCGCGYGFWSGKVDEPKGVKDETTKLS